MADFTWDAENPLARAIGETSKANSALHDYAFMGSGRSLRKLHQKYIEDTSLEPPTRHLRTLLGWSSKYAWQARVARFEAMVAEEEKAEYEAERLEWRKKRLQLLQGFFGKLAQALGKFEPDDATLGQLTPALKAAVQELRAEYDDLPTERRAVTAGLDEPTRQLLAQIGALAAHCITDPAKREEFVQGLQEMMGEETGDR
jgi:hypothetical protein